MLNLPLTRRSLHSLAVVLAPLTAVEPLDCTWTVIINLVYSLQGLIWDHLTFKHESEAQSDTSSEKTASAKMELGQEVNEGEKSVSSRAAQCLLDFPKAYTDVAPTWFLLVSYSLVLIVGGVLVGVIGIGIEKVLFCLVTWGARGIHVRDASISSVAVVGWLSGISMIVHAVSPRCPMAPGYNGAIPIDLWLMTMPGVFLGSLFGPTIARLLGARTVIWLFCLCLVGDTVENSLRLSGIVGDTCQAIGAWDCVLFCDSFPAYYYNSSSYSERPTECLARRNSSLPPYIENPAAIERNASIDDGDDMDVFSISFDGYYFDGMQHINLFSEPECCHGFGARYVPAQSPWPPIYVGSEARPLNERVAKFKAQPDGWVPSGAHRRTAAEDKRVLDATTLLPG